jgi:hypothetical protein
VIPNAHQVVPFLGWLLRVGPARVNQRIQPGHARIQRLIAFPAPHRNQANPRRASDTRLVLSLLNWRSSVKFQQLAMCLDEPGTVSVYGSTNVTR